ncbi:MAG TPA: zinc/iron-chelating domain-containing protein [Desulfobacteraceae bacterium]|nr:zinc/iron-chelating domain-containing protein [Desulfobacteraceae bacterium]
MPENEVYHLLKNYDDLLERIDSHVNRVTSLFSPHISCKKGCDACCRFLSLFPVEAFALSRAFSNLPENLRRLVLDEVKKSQGSQGSEGSEEKCPLLIGHACMLYKARPIICRTHGLPIYMEKDGEGMVDFCPENFKDLDALPKDAMLDLNQLNTLITAVNQHFVTHIEGDLPERIPVSQAVLLYQDLDEEA